MVTELAQPTPPAALTASVFAEGEATVITLRGEADLFTLPVVVDIVTRVIAEHDGPVVVDLARTDFVDTATVAALARASQYLSDRGRTLTLRSPSRMTIRVLEVLGFVHLIESARTTPASESHNKEEGTQWASS